MDSARAGADAAIRKQLGVMFEDESVAAIARAVLVEQGIAEVHAIVAQDRRSLYEEIVGPAEIIRAALNDVAYGKAVAAVDAVADMLAAVSDPLGEHLGQCPRCAEAMFEADAMDGPDEGPAYHQECWVRELADIVTGGSRDADSPGPQTGTRTGGDALTPLAVEITIPGDRFRRYRTPSGEIITGEEIDP